MRNLAEENIAGQKTYDEVNKELIKEYGAGKTRQKEADIVALRIAQILETSDFIIFMFLRLSSLNYTERNDRIITFMMLLSTHVKNTEELRCAYC